MTWKPGVDMDAGRRVVYEQLRQWPLATLGERNVRNPAHTTGRRDWMTRTLSKDA
jgi:hypothetical protein